MADDQPKSPEDGTPSDSLQPEAPGQEESASTDASQVEEALHQAEDAVAELESTVEEAAAAGHDRSAHPVELPPLNHGAGGTGAEGIDLLSDVNLNVKIELGRTKMLVEDVLKLSEDSVVELDKLAGDPVDIYVNDRPIARGEVLVLNDNFCIRVNEILSPATLDDMKAKQ